MIPKDVIEQIVGKAGEGSDLLDTFSFVFYKPEKYPDKNVIVDFEKGIVEIQYSEDQHETVRSNCFAIRVGLEPIDEESTEVEEKLEGE